MALVAVKTMRFLLLFENLIMLLILAGGIKVNRTLNKLVFSCGDTVLREVELDDIVNKNGSIYDGGSETYRESNELDELGKFYEDLFDQQSAPCQEYEDCKHRGHPSGRLCLC